MKTLFLMTAVLFSTQSFARDFIITSTTDGEVTIGFSDSSFDYNAEDTKHEKNFCYVGSISKICGQLINDARVMSQRYSQGAHDDIEIKTCDVIEDMDSDGYHRVFGSRRVITTYRLSDDYGSDFVVTREIKACSKVK